MFTTHPKIDKPWVLGMHQCSYPRIWTHDEKKLFQEISRRLADALTAQLFFKNLQESETKYHRIVDTANEGILVLDKNMKISITNHKMASLIGYGHCSNNFYADRYILAHCNDNTIF